jgi:hypothetical protein
VDFSLTPRVFGDIVFIEMLFMSSGVSDIGGVDTLEMTLGFRLGRVLKEVLVLLDVMNPMLFSVPTGEVTSRMSDEDSVANEVLFELPAGMVPSPSLLEVFFLFLAAFLFFGFGLSAMAFSCSAASGWAGTFVSWAVVEVDFSSFCTSVELAAGLLPWIEALSIDSERDFVGVAAGVGRAEVNLALIVSKIETSNNKRFQTYEFCLETWGLLFFPPTCFDPGPPV